MAQLRTVETTANLFIGAIDQDVPLRVTGTYHKAQPAFTYRGEMAPTDPPEPAMFEMYDIKTLDPLRKEWVLLPWALSADMTAALEEKCLEEIEKEEGGW